MRKGDGIHTDREWIWRTAMIRVRCWNYDDIVLKQLWTRSSVLLIMRYVVCQTQCNLVLSISVSLRQLSNRSSSAIAYAYHPGTVLTPFTFPIIGSPKPDLSQGRLTVDQAIDHLVNVMSQVKRGVQGVVTKVIGVEGVGTGKGKWSNGRRLMPY